MTFDRKSHFGSVGLARVGVDAAACFVPERVCISRDGNQIPPHIFIEGTMINIPPLICLYI